MVDINQFISFVVELFCDNPFQPNVVFHVETNHLIFSANQMAGSYIESNTEVKRINIYKGICSKKEFVNPLSANPLKWSHTQTICRPLPTNCFSEFDHFMGLALIGFNNNNNNNQQ